MGVDPKRKMIRDYWPRYKKLALGFTIAMQVLLTVIIGASLLFADVDVTAAKFWVSMIAILAASLGINIIVMNQLLLPLRDLWAALTHASGEPTDVIPPNPNAKHYEQNGFKPLLQYIYENHSSRAASPTDETAKAVGDITRAFDQTSAGIVVMDDTGKILFYNKKAPVSITQEGEKHLNLIFEDNDTFDAWLESQKDSVHGEKSWLRVADKLVGEEGRRIFDISVSYEKGSGSDVVMVLHDRTALYQPEDDSLDFISFAAHELRGPITVIRGYLDVLDIEIGETLDQEQRELIKRLVVSANRLSGYINNILNASKYDRRHLKIRLVEDSLHSIYETINDDMQLRAQSQNRLLSVAIPDNLPTIAADRSSLSEVIANLIDNGLKYSNEGGSVSVTATLDGNMVKVNVEDHGIGMPSNVVSNLFHKFYRSHRSRETVSGTGIGLYICKAIVESHGGTIGVKSQDGVGSVFTFSVPTYASVKDKLLANGNTNDGLISQGTGWIKNHNMYNG